MSETLRIDPNDKGSDNSNGNGNDNEGNSLPIDIGGWEEFTRSWMGDDGKSGAEGIIIYVDDEN